MSTTTEKLDERQFQWVTEGWEKWMAHYLGASYQTDEVKKLPGGDRILFWRKEYGPPGNVSLCGLWEAEHMPRDSIRRQAAIAAAAVRNCTLEEVDPELSDERLDQLVKEQDTARQAAPDADWRVPKNRSLREVGLPDSELEIAPAERLPTKEDHGPITVRGGGGEGVDGADGGGGGGNPRGGKGGKDPAK